MSLVIWDESFLTHITHIDDQHKRLVDWINTLSEAIDNGEGEQAVSDILKKLVSYVFEHFSDEERLMLSYDFPGFKKHRSEHDFFVQKLKEVQGEFNKGIPMGRAAYMFMMDWLICHIKGTDQKLSHFIMQKRNTADNG